MNRTPKLDTNLGIRFGGFVFSFYMKLFNSVAADTEIKSQLTYNKVNKRIVLLVISIEF